MRLLSIKHFLMITLIFIGVLISFSCRNLLYDEEYARIAVTTNNMTRVANIGPIHFDDVRMDEWDIVFIPDQGDYSNGFLVVQKDYQFTMWYVTKDRVISEAYTQSFSSGDSFARGMTVPNQPGYIRFFVFDGGDYQTRIFYYNNGKIEGGNFTSTLQSTISQNYDGETGSIYNYTPISNVKIGGLFFSPIDDFSYYFLSSVDQPNEYYEIKCSDNTGVMETYDNWGISLGSEAAKVLLGFEDHGFRPYVHNVRNHTSYLSQYNGSTFDVYTWNNTSYGSPQKIAGLTQKIDYVLSTNHIMSLAEESISVFDDKGGGEFKISLGTLDFVYENTTGDSSTEMVFTHVGLVPNHSDSRRDEVYIKVYTLPTSDIEKLRL